MALMTWVLGAAPFLAMIAVEVSMVGTAIVTKAAMTQGMSNLVFIVYSDLVAVIILLPLAIIRRKGNTLSLWLLCKFFLISLIGSTAHICVFAGLKYGSPTLAYAIRNLIPLVSYFLAIMMRLEKLDLRSSAGLAVSLGAVVSALGASVATLYQGPDILTSSFPSGFHDLHSQQSNWGLGGLLLAVASLLVSIWYIFMTMLVTEFPERDTIVFFSIFFSTIITGIFSLLMETNPNAWKLRVDIELIAILLTGIVGEFIRIVVSTWCLKMKGVACTVMFMPLGFVLSVMMSVAFLGEPLHTGSLVGGILVIVGFYALMWGKEKEQGPRVGVPESSADKAPLLLSNHHNHV